MSLQKESVAVVTGAASGIGRALSLRLAKEQIAGIAIADLNDAGLAETASMLREHPVKVTSHIVDVADADAMRAFADEVYQGHGRASHVFNNAGVALGGTIREASLDEMSWVMSINFWGVVHGTKFFLPYLEKESSAHIVNISSLFGLIAPPGQGAYCASKFAVRGFTEVLRHEMAGTNIAVSVVHPGGISTNIANSARIAAGSEMSDEQIAKRKALINKNLARTTPDQAADIIVRGVIARQPRIIVGPDARIISSIARVFPRRYLAVLNFISRGRLKVT